MGFDVSPIGMLLAVFAFGAAEIIGLFAIVYFATRLAIRHERRRAE